MPLIDDVFIQAQRDLAIREQQITAQLLRAYDVTLARIQRDLRTVDAQIAELIAIPSRGYGRGE